MCGLESGCWALQNAARCLWQRALGSLRAGAAAMVLHATCFLPFGSLLAKFCVFPAGESAGVEV